MTKDDTVITRRMRGSCVMVSAVVICLQPLESWADCHGFYPPPNALKKPRNDGG